MPNRTKKVKMPQQTGKNPSMKFRKDNEEKYMGAEAPPILKSQTLAAAVMPTVLLAVPRLTAEVPHVFSAALSGL